MTAHPTLFDLPGQGPPRYNVFFGIFPDRATAQHIVARAARLREDYGLRGRIRPVDHLHVTLHFLGRCAEVPPKWAAALDEVCGKVAAQVPGFELILDRVICFQNRRRESPVVLSCGQAANPSLRSLHRHLLEELARVGFRVGNRAHLVPHLTLLYDRRGLRETPIEPVTWPVQEVVLVRSEVGATKYVPLGRWPLRG